MNNIQQYIDELKLQKEKANKASERNKDAQKWYAMEKWDEVENAFSFAITLAELLLLNKPTVAITETAHCANTLLSECADSKDGQVIGVVGADSSETEIVKQNEQTKEDCRNCKHSGNSLGEDPCFDCFGYDRWEAI